LEGGSYLLERRVVKKEEGGMWREVRFTTVTVDNQTGQIAR
jgi:hypothetical protein